MTLCASSKQINFEIWVFLLFNFNIWIGYYIVIIHMGGGVLFVHQMCSVRVTDLLGSVACRPLWRVTITLQVTSAPGFNLLTSSTSLSSSSSTCIIPNTSPASNTCILDKPEKYSSFHIRIWSMRIKQHRWKNNLSAIIGVISKWPLLKDMNWYKGVGQFPIKGGEGNATKYWGVHHGSL